MARDPNALQFAEIAQLMGEKELALRSAFLRMEEQEQTIQLLSSAMEEMKKPKLADMDVQTPVGEGHG